jgi:hypothetical protein
MNAPRMLLSSPDFIEAGINALSDDSVLSFIKNNIKLLQERRTIRDIEQPGG